MPKFKPGESGNLKGRPKDPPELHAIKKLNKNELELLVNKLLQAKPEELKQMNSSVLELWLSSGAANGIKRGDYTNLKQLIEQLIGKVPDKVEADQTIKIIVEDYTSKK